MFEQKTGFWVVDQRPKETGQMMLTEEMRTELSSLKKKELKNFVVFGPRGIGKTLFCQAVSGFKGSISSLGTGGTRVDSASAVYLSSVFLLTMSER